MVRFACLDSNKLGQLTSSMSALVSLKCVITLLMVVVGYYMVATWDV